MSKNEFARLATLANIEGTAEIAEAFRTSRDRAADKARSRRAKKGTRGAPVLVVPVVLATIEPLADVRGVVTVTVRARKRSALATKVAIALAQQEKKPFGPRGQAVLAAWQADLARESAGAAA